MNQWQDKVAVVTGASSGIGAAIAEKLVEAGVIVAGLARRVELVEALAQKLSDKPGKLYAFRADITAEEEILNILNCIERKLGSISILINNAGVIIDASCTDGDTNAWKKILDTNVLGLSICTKEVIKQMRKNNIDGHIVHINSVLGHKIAERFSPMYMASKFAVTALTEALRQELTQLKSKIKISSVSPGFTKSELFFVSEWREEDEIYNLFLKGPHLLSADVADAVLYILATPPHVQVHDVIIKPVGETF